jgi:hypothetical protein
MGEEQRQAAMTARTQAQEQARQNNNQSSNAGITNLMMGQHA